MSRPSRQYSSHPPRFIQKHERSLIPIGTSTGLPLTAQRIRRVEKTLIDVLERWDYRELIPPTFEYLDVLAAGLEPEVLENCYKFPDRTTGRILLLRPDVTAQIARMVSMGMLGWDFPLRLSYRTTVFRYEPEHAGRDREVFQVGAELIGVDDVVTDGEVLSLLIECLQGLGLTSFKISLGHVGFFKGLLSQTGMSLEGRKRAEHAAARKDIPRLEEILASEKVAKKKGEGIRETLGLYGQEEVLKRGEVLAGSHPELVQALDRLRKVYRLLVDTGMKEFLVLDLGEFRGFDYYDGIAFDVFADGVGHELGGGGRYNHLISRFGKSIPSTGFGFDIDRLFQALEPVAEDELLPQKRCLLAASKRDAPRMFQVAQWLRQAGFRVVRGKVGPLPKQASAGAILEEARSLAVSSVVILGDSTVAPDEALVFNCADAQQSMPGTAKRNARVPSTVQRKKRSRPQMVKIKDLRAWLKRAS